MIPTVAFAATPAAMQAAAAPVAEPQRTQVVQLPVAPTQIGTHAPTSPGLGGALVALLLVLALIVGLAWLLKRLPGAGLRQADGLRVITSISLGARERAAVVQVGNEQLLLGIGAGGVRTLHRLPEPLPAAGAASPLQPRLPDFRQLLAQRLRKDR